MNVQHASMAGADLHEAKRIKQPVRAATTANISTSAPGATLDGVALANGDRILLKDQTTQSQNGIYTWTGAAAALTRTTDLAVSADFAYGFQVFVREGTVNASRIYVFTQTVAVTVGTTAITFAQVGASGSGTFSGEVSATDFAATGLTGATAASRYVGATASGPPVSGTFAVGDAVIGRDASIWICTAAGSPGTWKKLDANPMTAVGDLIIGGTVANGYAAMSRLAAGTSGFVLTSNGAGLAPSYQASTGGGGTSTGGGGSGALVPIQVIGPLTAAQASLAFSGIPQTGYRNLKVVLVARGNAVTTSVSGLLQFNGDTGTNYYDQVFQESGATGGGTDGNAAADTSIAFGTIAAASAPSANPSAYEIDVPNFTGTTFQKVALARGATRYGTASGNLEIREAVGVWAGTGSLTSITLSLSSGSFDVGTYACLYGVMDTAGPLLAPASNLITETVLSSGQASIALPNLSQAYRDLVIRYKARAATNVTPSLNIRLNNDSGANYNQHLVDAQATAFAAASSTAQTATRVGSLNSSTDTAGRWVYGEVRIPYYTRTDNHKRIMSRSSVQASGTGSPHELFDAGEWASTAAVTQVTLLTADGSNFEVGTVVSVYGEPVSAGGNATGTGTRLRISANQSVTNSVATTVNWDTEDSDADNQHFTSAANLTGTVDKSSGSQTLTGTGTVFLTELSVGQVISVPGIATEKRVVTGIASNTSLTVSTAFANSASGQTAARLNSPIVFRQPGTYAVTLGAYFAAVASGNVTLQVKLNDSTVIAEDVRTAVNASAGYNLALQRPFQQWDFVEAVVTQSSAGAVNLTADERTHFEANSRPTVIVAVPYACVKDQKAQNTAGGTFTSGADRTRDLNTIDTDTAGIASVASNQVTLPSGTYRYKIRAPAYQCGAHQAFLYNVTDAAEVKRGSTESAGTAAATTTSSHVTGKMTLSGSKTFEVRHRCTTTSTTNGFGLPANFGAEVYTVFEAWKEG